MTLQMNVNTDIGLLIENAYIRIDEQSGNKESINLRIRSYLSQEKQTAGCAWISEKIITFTPDVSDGAPNFIKQGYEYLKTIPEFETAVDC
jgi:hypothetical protein